MAKNNCYVTIGIIALNEEKNIKVLLSQINNQTYPHEDIEIILINSMSTDNTRNIMNDFASNNNFSNVRVFDNPKKTQASSWNIVIDNAKGDVIIRLDAHSLIPNNFVSENVNCISSGESVCGGHRKNIIEGDSLYKKTLLMAETSLFGSGVATYRNSNKTQYVKTVPHACYKKEVFEKCGKFNETLLRSEDNEMHFRIRQNGYNICMSDKIYSEYQTRSSLSGMMKQKWGNGEWIGITSIKKSPKIFSFYHYIPFLFVFAALICSVLGILALASVLEVWYTFPFVIGVILYFTLDILLSLKACKDYNEYRAFLGLMLIFPLLHFSYGLGTLFGFVKSIFIHIE